MWIRRAAIALGVAFLVAILLMKCWSLFALEWVWPYEWWFKSRLTEADQASWLEAIGTLVAFGAAIGVPYWQRKNELGEKRKERKKAEARRRRRARAIAVQLSPELKLLNSRVTTAIKVWKAAEKRLTATGIDALAAGVIIHRSAQHSPAPMKDVFKRWIAEPSYVEEQEELLVIANLGALLNEYAVFMSDVLELGLKKSIQVDVAKKLAAETLAGLESIQGLLLKSRGILDDAVQNRWPEMDAFLAAQEVE